MTRIGITAGLGQFYWTKPGSGMLYSRGHCLRYMHGRNLILQFN